MSETKNEDQAPRAHEESSDTTSMKYMDCGENSRVELPLEQEEGLSSELAHSRHRFSDIDEESEIIEDAKSVTDKRDFGDPDNMYDVQLGSISTRSLKSFNGTESGRSTSLSVKKQAPSPPAEPISALVNRVEGDTSVPEKTRKQNAKAFLLSVEGMLFIAEILGAFLCWTLIAGWSHAGESYRMPCPLGFSMCFFIVSWVMTGALLGILAAGLDAKYKLLKITRMPVFGMVYNCIWATLYLIGGSIAGSKAVSDMTQVLAAATSFAFIVLLLYVSHGLLHFRRQFGQCPCNYFEGCNKECTTQQ